MDDMITSSVSIPVMTGTLTDTITISGTGASGASITTAYNSILNFDIDNFLDEHIMSRVTCDHKVAGHELLKLKEVAPDYANEIKENLARNVSRDIMKKITFTKKLDKDADVHHFIGRVWVFTEDELKNLIKEARNV